MARVDLTTNKAAIEKAWKEVTRPESKIDWAVFGYDGKSYTLKVVETGEDGFEEMTEELNGGKIMYAVCRVNDPNTSLPKLVFVNWQGEGVPSNVKGVCANHLRDVTNLFRGCHVTINARSETDLDYDTVLDKVKKSSGANYSIHKEKPKPVEQIKPVGAVYKRINPVREIDIQKRDKFWNKQEVEEKNRVTEEKQKAEAQKQQEEEKRKTREKKEEVARDEMIRERSKSIDQQRAAHAKHEQKRGDEEKKRYHEVMKEKEKDDQEFRKRSDSERKKRLQEVQSAISSRPSMDAERTKFTPAAKSRVPPPTQPKRKVPKAINEPSPTNQQPVVVATEAAPKEPNKAAVEQISAVAEQKELPDLPKEAHDMPEADLHVTQTEPEAEIQSEPEADLQVTQTEPEAEIQSEEAYHQQPAAEVEQKNEATVEGRGGHVARALYDYQAAGVDEISFDPGDIIEEIEQVDEGWWRGKAPNGAYGLFPANYVEVIDPNQTTPQVAEQSPDPPSSSDAADQAPLSQGLFAKAIFDYQAEGEDEISFDPGDIIEEIEQVDEGWWRGKAPNGAYGLFPANYVEVIDPNQTTSTNDNQPQDSQEAVQTQEMTQPQGVCARAIYDYQAVDDTEISFDPDDVITEIDQVDANWWRGQAPNGSYGMFPANYVELI